jgi:hypothetical protein
LRDDFREVGVPTYSLVRGAEISEPIELSLASLRKKCRGKVRVCTGDDAEGGIMESKDVGGCDPVEVNRRLVALRSNPEKVETIDALELTESGREEGEGICGFWWAETDRRTIGASFGTVDTFANRSKRLARNSLYSSSSRRPCSFAVASSPNR